MPAQTTLAAGILAALSVSALLAQQQNSSEPFFVYDQSGAKPSRPISPAALPPLIHFCGGGCSAGKGGTLTLENGRYPSYDKQGLSGWWEIQKLDRDSVIIQRNDIRPYPGKATVTGRLSPEGNSIVNGIIDWTWHPCCGTARNPFQMAWGDALDTVPADGNGPPAIPACDAQATATTAQAIENGVQAMDRKKRTIGLCWFQIAAAQGNPLAEGALATIYYRGLGVPVDYAEALKHATKSAAAKNYLGEDCLYLIYLNGNGVPKNPEKAEMYRQLAERDKLLAEQEDKLEAQKLAAQRQQQADQQQGQMQGIFSLLDLFGSSEPKEPKKSSIGCAPGVVNYNCYSH